MPNIKALVTGDKTASVQDVEIPSPGQGEILVKVHYVAQNPTDWKGLSATPAGRIVGCDFAGTIDNANSSSWREGQRVAGFVQGKSADPIRGAFAEYVVVESSLVFAIPDAVAYKDAAAIPLAFATAAQALFQRLGLPEPSKPAKTAFPLLVNGGTSSVGKYAVQLAKAAGLYVIATGSKKNHELLKELGADAVVDYKDGDWVEQIKRVSHDELRHAFDCIAEVESTKSVAAALSPTKGGHVVCILPRKQSEIPDNLTKVKVESTIVYTVFERPLQGGYKAFDNCGERTPQDKAFWEKYLTLLPGYLEKGTIKPNRVRELGIIGDIMKGFKEQEEGKVSAEKLVYKITRESGELKEML
ncbi:zinc-binding dehydrogenase [Xylariales sp. AK1849]|nr:zinc-binding dehydrogenase [Xylariales sp. AK1849]